LKDEKGVLWTGTYGNGVNYLDTHTGERRNFRNDPLDKNSISNDRINSIFQDRNNNLWFATEDGLCKWNSLTRTFRRYGTAEGFPSNFIMCILEDQNNNLWISTTKGLVCFNPFSQQLKVYTISNGLLSDQLNFSSAYKDDNGNMYFGSSKGMISFQPAEFMQTRFIPPVYITGFQVNNKEVLTSNGTTAHNSVTFTDQITLAYNQRTFSIDFAALSYTAPEMLKYAYKLEGLSKEWTHLNKNQKVYFTEIAPGTYLFKVKATNSSGVWNARETTLTIIVLPPWWKSWWAYLFYSLCVMLLALSVFRTYHFRMKERARRNLELLEIAKEKELYHAKMEFFTNVAHEIRTPLTLIKGPLEKIIRKAAGIQEMQTSLRIMERNTNRLLELTNELLDFRQTEINGYSLSFVLTDVCELVEEIYQVFISLAEQSNIEMQLILPPDNIHAHIDQGAFTKIIYNLCSNALKYASSKMIIEMAIVDNDQLVIKVKSNGSPIPETVKEKIFEPFFRLKETHKIKGSGIGLALSRSLALLLKGTLVLAAPEESMNTFILTLPVQQGNEITLTSVEQQETIRN
jgi:signal transduction histidine kinase